MAKEVLLKHKNLPNVDEAPDEPEVAAAIEAEEATAVVIRVTIHQSLALPSHRLIPTKPATTPSELRDDRMW